MRLKFTKMHGAGNDFVMIDAVTQKVELTPAEVRFIADRHFGVGCDQLLVVEKPASPAADFRYRIYNADGGEVEQCGNGARCFVRFVRDRGLTQKSEIRVETMCGLIAPRLEASGEVTVDMGAPIFDLARVPFKPDAGAKADAPMHTLQLDGATAQISVVSMGNPHAVQFIADVDTAPVTTQGPAIENHPAFPKRVNAGYAEVVDRHSIRLRVWERGAGETLACGTGACAAVVGGIRRGLLSSPVKVATRGGDLTIKWDGAETSPVWMTGPAVKVFDGEIDLAEK